MPLPSFRTKILRRPPFILSACLAAIPAFASEPPEFESLFDGSTLSGWHLPAGDNGHWRVIDGVIDYDARSEAPGDKNLWTVREFGDFELRVEWRIKETPFVNPHVPYILPDGTHARDSSGRPLALALPDSDSGIFFRGGGTNQVNIWTWPIGSGELYGYRTDASMPASVRAAVTPRTQADKPVGDWNRFEITLRGDRIWVILNGTLVIEGATLPGVPPSGRIGLQHHGAQENGRWISSPSLVQFRRLEIRELSSPK